METHAPDSSSSGGPQEDLVFLYLEEREQGVCANVEEFSERHPEAASGSVHERIRALESAGLLARADVAEPFPERLGDFRLIERLGGGGMGVVFRAEQSSLGREVALKLIRPELLYFPGAKERFRREIEAVARLSHPGIVPVYACGEERGVPYCAMELVSGVSLGDALRRLAGRAPHTLTGRDLAALVGADARGEWIERSWTDECIDLVRQVTAALDHAHSRGVVHRDVKPSNIMLTADGRALLLDFGLAARRGAARLTGVGAQLGSTAYMSPEQASGAAADADARTDVYSLGVTFYELLTLRLPYVGAGMTEIVARIMDGRPEAPRRVNARLSLDVQTVCLTAMAVEPGRRYATARALGADLDALLDRRPISVRPLSAPERLVRWARRSPARAAAVALAAVLLVGGPLTYGALQARAAREQRLLNDKLQTANEQIAAREQGLAAANQELEAALERETAERLRAQKNFDRAARSVDEMLADVGADTLEDVPQMEPVRRKLLEKALAFYEELAADAPTNVDVQREGARADRSIGDLLRELGRFDEAREHYESAVARLRELFETDPSFATRDPLAATLSMLAAQYNAAGDGERAESLWREAVDLLEAEDLCTPERYRVGINLILTRSSLAFGVYSHGALEESLELYQRSVSEARALSVVAPDDEDLGYALASALSAMAQVLGHAARAQECDRAYEQAFAQAAALLERTPGSVRFRSLMVEVANNYGLRLLAGSDHERTTEVLQQGLDVARSLASEFPHDPDKRRDLAVIGVNLASHVGNRGDLAAASAIFSESVAALESLAAEFPDRIEYPYFLAASLANLAGVTDKLGQVDEARAECERAILLLRDALEATGGHVGVRAQLASALFVRAGISCSQGDVERAVEQASEGASLATGRADVLYEGVEVMGRIARTARDAHDAPRERDAVDAGLDLLDAALESGFSDGERLRESADVALLREQPRFGELLARLAAR